MLAGVTQPPSSSASDAFWRSSGHAASGRSAFVADEGDSVWLYLTVPDGVAIAADCWLFNRVPALPGPELEARYPEYRARSQPPPAPAEVTTPDAFRAAPFGEGEVRFAWSVEGDSVAVFVGGRLAGFIARAQPGGHSAHLLSECPWGRPADLGLYAQLFGAPPDEDT